VTKGAAPKLPYSSQNESGLEWATRHTCRFPLLRRFIFGRAGVVLPSFGKFSFSREFAGGNDSQMFNMLRD
jgi:hypothetical protein